MAVDLRKGSPTFGKWIAERLSESNKKMFYIPRGFAHGFLALSDIADVLYTDDNGYAPDFEGGLIWNDPQLGIDWPLKDPILSEKDKKWPSLAQL